MRRELPAEWKRNAEARGRLGKRAVRSINAALQAIEAMAGQTGDSSVDFHVEMATRELRAALMLLHTPGTPEWTKARWY